MTVANVQTQVITSDATYALRLLPAAVRLYRNRNTLVFDLGPISTEHICLSVELIGFGDARRTHIPRASTKNRLLA